MESRNLEYRDRLGMRFTADRGPDGEDFSRFDYYEEHFNPALRDLLQVHVPGTTMGDFKTPNSFAYSKETVSYMQGMTIFRAGNNPVKGYYTSIGFYWGEPNRGLFPEFHADTYNTAVDRLNEQLRGAIDLSIDLLQLGDSVALARKIGNVISQFRAIRKGNLEDWYREFKRYKHGSPQSVGSKWLAWIYGIKPILQTIYDLLEFRLNRVQTLMVVEARASNTGSGQNEKQPYSLSPDHTARVTWRASDRCHIKVRMRPPETFAQILGNLTSLNPASIAWELTPFSFVADWFYDIGGYLRALETALLYGSLFVDGFILRSYRNWGEVHVFDTVGYGSDTWIQHEHSGSYQRTSYDRQRLVSYPFPKPPTFKVDLSSARLLNAAALLSQFLPRR